MRKILRWCVALLAAAIMLGGCNKGPDAGSGWTAVDYSPVGEQIWKKHYDADKVTIYVYGHYTITVVKDAP